MRCYGPVMNLAARALVLLFAAPALLLPACSGGAGSGCRSSAECMKPLECAGPSEPRVCGIPPRQGCARDGDCGGGQRCHAIADSCSPNGVGSECGPPCGACGAGLRCNAGGACEPVPCDEGYRCTAPLVCDAAAGKSGAAVYQRHQGCVRVACTSDGACAAGQACVNGYCQSGPGQCQMVLIVP